jgi:tryptophanyl-tRNA synthetase
MSLTDPTKKMSKSDANKKSRILITDTKEEIQNKVRTALTDSIEGPLTYDRKMRPGVSNLIELMYCCGSSGTASIEEHAERMQHLSIQELKATVVHAIDEEIREVRARYEELMRGDEKVLIDIEEDGARRAEVIAETTMKRVRDAVGMGW